MCECMCLCVRVCTYVCMCVRAFVHVCGCVQCVCMCNVCAGVYGYMHVRVYAYMCVCLYVCIKYMCTKI